MSTLQDNALVAPAARPLRAQHADRRADGNVRSVSLSRETVRIDRSLKGIAMRLTVPVQAYRGVALTLRPDQDGTPCYRLHLLHRDRDLSVDLDAAHDEADIVADWRLWSRFFGLPALVERELGRLEDADTVLGALLLGRSETGRRGPRRSTRRSRFAARRKAGVVAATATVHADEREIIART